MKFLMKAMPLALFCALAPISVAANFGRELQQAVAPLDRGIPEVAVVQLERLLKGELSSSEQEAVRLRLGEALLASGRPQEGLAVLQDLRTDTASFWRAQALTSLRRWSEALKEYDRTAGVAGSRWSMHARFGRGEALRALGRNEEAANLFSGLLSHPDWAALAQLRLIEIHLDQNRSREAAALLSQLRPNTPAQRRQRRYLRARLERLQGRTERAIELFENVLKDGTELPHQLRLATLLSLADAYLALQTPGNAENLLEDYIESYPHDPALAQIFTKLDECYRRRKKPSRSVLAKWTRDPLQPRRALALWYLARSEVRADLTEKALSTFEQLQREAYRHPELALGYAEYAQLLQAQGRAGEALRTLEAAQALKPRPEIAQQISWRIAETRYGMGDPVPAAEMFEKIAATNGSQKAALYNASIAWLRAENTPRLRATFEEVGAHDAGATRELLLEKALSEAAHGEPQAEGSMHAFLRQFPQSPQVASAWLALAELAFQAAPPRLEESRQYLEKAREAKPSLSLQERMDYLAIWIEEADSRQEPKRVIELAQKFLQQHERSSLAPEVRMKLAESFFGQHDYANAQSQFQILSEISPVYSEKALFFAAQAAAARMAPDSLNQALTLLDDVAGRDGEMKWAARNEQAAISRRQGKWREALLLYGEVLEGTAPPPAKWEALCGRGDLYLQNAEKDSENYRRAIIAYDKLANEEKAPAHWRNQALFKKGVALEKLGERADALVAFYQVLEKTDEETTPEYLWFYKAGFNAARLLEEEAKWKSAAAIYQTLAMSGGGRAEEAQQRLSRLRLEHTLADPL